MRASVVRAGALGAVALGTVLLCPPAHAQTASPAAPDASPSALRLEVGLFAGVKGDAQAVHGGRFGDALGLAGVELHGGVGAFDVDASLHLLGTPSAHGARLAFPGALRLGYRGGPLAIRAGAALQWATLQSAKQGQSVANLQPVPSLHAGYSFGRFGLSAGVFDGLGYAPAHLSAHLDAFSLGFVAPLGLRAGAALPLGENLGLRAEGVAFALGRYQSALLTLSIVFGPDAGTATGRSAP